MSDDDSLWEEIDKLRERLALIHGMVTAEPTPNSISNDELMAKIAELSKPEDEGGEKMTLGEYHEWRRNMLREAVANFDSDSKDS